MENNLEQKTTDIEHYKASLEHYKATIEKYKADLQSKELAVKIWTPGFQSIIELTIFGIKSLIFVNGGAILALLTFLGNILNKLSKTPPELEWTIIYYFCGLGLSLSCLLTAYIFQVFELEFKGRFKYGDCISGSLRVVAVIIAILSFVSFLFGSFEAVEMFKNLPSILKTSPTLPLSS